MIVQALLILAATCALLSIAVPAMAYIDPGTGSFLIQGIIAVVIGAGVTLKVYWTQLRAMFSGRAASKDEDDDVE